MRILVSKCLLGCPCRYDGKDNNHPAVMDFLDGYEVVAVCPEQLGGLPTPRPPSERIGDKVIAKTGEDFTLQFERGGQKALQIAKESHIFVCVLKARSPSCGSGIIYDGTFTHTKVKGDGVTAEALKREGFPVFTEEELEQLKAYIASLPASG